MFRLLDQLGAALALAYQSNPEDVAQQPVSSAAPEIGWHELASTGSAPVDRYAKPWPLHEALDTGDDVGAFRELNQHLANLWHSSAFAIVTVDVEGAIRLANQSARCLLAARYGRRASGLLPLLASEHQQLMATFLRDQFASVANTSKTSGIEADDAPQAIEVQLARSPTESVDGPPWIQATLIGRGRSTLSLALEDVTARHRLEADKLSIKQQLWQLQRLELVNHVSSGIAHELNNMLQIVQAYGAIIQHNSNSVAAIDDSIREILAATERASSLVRRMLGFGRRAPLQLMQHDLKDVVIGCVDICKRAFTKMAVQCHLPPQAVVCMLDRTLMEQVILNLCINARDAMPDGGRLTIALDCEVRAKSRVGGQHLSAGSYARLSISDTGVGIPAELQEKVFEAFFTTKQVESGTGLGLSLVRDILWEHSGSIELWSQPGQGSRFTIRLPLGQA